MQSVQRAPPPNFFSVGHAFCLHMHVNASPALLLTLSSPLLLVHQAIGSWVAALGAKKPTPGGMFLCLGPTVSMSVCICLLHVCVYLFAATDGMYVRGRYVCACIAMCA